MGQGKNKNNIKDMESRLILIFLAVFKVICSILICIKGLSLFNSLLDSIDQIIKQTRNFFFFFEIFNHYFSFFIFIFFREYLNKIKKDREKFE